MTKKKLVSMGFPVIALALVLTGALWAGQAPQEEPVAPEAPAPEVAPEPPAEEGPSGDAALEPAEFAPTEQSWCAVLHADSATECEQKCYDVGCGFDHWDSSTCDCYCGFEF